MHKKILINSAFENYGPQKVRAARAWLRWSLDDANKITKIARTYISQIELGLRNATDEEKAGLYEAFRAHGVLMTEDGLEAIEAEETNQKG